jgi:hypothetical protein
LGSIRTPKISGLILRHELLSPPPRNFQRGNLLYKLVSSTNLVVPKKCIGSLRSICSYFVYDDRDEVAISSEI